MNHKYKNLFVAATAIFALGSLASPCQAAVTLIDNDLDTAGISNNGRMRLNQLDGDFYKNSNSLWAISGGTLSNSGMTAGVPSEGGISRLVSSSTDTSLTKVTVSFGYNVGVGSILYFHLRGLTTNGTPAADEQLGNTGAQGGSIQNQADTNFGVLSLITGTQPGNGTEGTVSFASGTSGTFTATYDLTAYSWYAGESGLTGSISSIADFDYILAAFASNVNNNDGTGAISINNFSVTAVPEPSSSLLALGGLAGLLIRRKR